MSEIEVMGVFAFGALMVIFIRLRATRKPVTARKILIPPVTMGSGFSMFFIPSMRVNVSYLFLAFIVGNVASQPLIKSTDMSVRKGAVYVRRSKGFIVVLLGLLMVRLGLHRTISQYLSLQQTASCFFVLAFGMIVPWRISMWIRYQAMMRRMRVSQARERRLS